MVARGRRCPFAAWCVLLLDFEWDETQRCGSSGHAQSCKDYATHRQPAFDALPRLPATAKNAHRRAACVPAPRTPTVLRRTMRVLRCIEMRRAPGSPHARAICPKAPHSGLSARVSCNWHRPCIKPCHRINVDPSRVQHKVLAAGQVRTTASPEFSHRLGSRDAVFISGIVFAPCRKTAPATSTSRKPRS
jgi:hypothetical protein